MAKHAARLSVSPIAGSLLALSALAGSLIASGPAGQGSPNDRKTAIKRLNSSPWVVIVIPPRAGAGEGRADPGAEARVREEARVAREKARESERANPGLDTGLLRSRTDGLRRIESLGQSPQIARRQAPLGVRWISAKSMQEALGSIMRQPVEGLPEDFQVLLSLTTDFHAIAIGEERFVATGSPCMLRRFESGELSEEIRLQAYLSLPDNRTVAPAAAALFSLGTYEPMPIFFFRRTLNGKPLIGTHFKNVVFHYRGLTAKFNLSKMKYDGAPDW